MDALLLVDIQNDFLPGGALAVPEEDQVVPVANRLLGKFDLVVATQDWHPADHGSFASQHPNHQIGDCVDLNGVSQILWPDHCIQETAGAEFAPALDRESIHRVFTKGTHVGIDSYSGFFDNDHQSATGLGEFLQDQRVRRVFVMGLATDYCVKFTALDAVALGFETNLVVDGCRGVDLQDGDVERAVSEMTQAGVRAVPSSEI